MQIKCEILPGRWRSETSSCLRRSDVPACLRLYSGRGWRNKTAGWRPGEPVMGSAPWCSLSVSLCLCARFCPCLCSPLILFSPVLTSLPGSAPLLLLQAGYCFRVMVMMQGGRSGGGGWRGGWRGGGGDDPICLQPEQCSKLVWPTVQPVQEVQLKTKPWLKIWNIM